jgi:hypothetical protein
MGERDPAEPAGGASQHVVPVARLSRRDLQLGQHQLDDAVEQLLLARREPVQAHRVAVERPAEAPHRQGLHPVGVDQAQRRDQHVVSGQHRAARAARPARFRIVGVRRACHLHDPPAGVPVRYNVGSTT